MTIQSIESASSEPPTQNPPPATQPGDDRPHSGTEDIGGEPQNPAAQQSCAGADPPVRDTQTAPSQDGDWVDEDDDAGDFIHATRKTRTKEERERGKGKKAGPQGKFKGEVLEFLQSQQYLYEEIKALEKGKVRRLRAFWHDLRVGFWRKFTVGQLREMWGVEAQAWKKGKLVEKVNNVSILSVFHYALY